MEDIRNATIEEMMDDEGFSIKDDRTAEWALKKIREAKDEADRIAADCEDEISYYQAVQTAAEKKYESSTGFLKGKLLEYFGSVNHQETKTQESYKLPSGQLVMKKARLGLEHDDEKLIGFMKANGYGEYVKVTEKPAWEDFKKTLTVVDGAVINKETGEVIEGVTVVEKPESFEVKV